MTTPKTVEQKGDVYEYVPAATQKEAMIFLNSQVFTTPSWLLDKAIFSKIGNQSVDVVGKVQDGALGKLLSAPVLDRLIKGTALNGEKAYKVTDLFDGLNKGIWTELITKKPIDLYRRNLQKSYVEKLTAMLNTAPPQQPIPGLMIMGAGGASKTNDVLSVARAQAKLLVSRIKAAAPLEKDELSRWHLQDLADRLTESLDPKK